jgi:hypothetical protein
MRMHEALRVSRVCCNGRLLERLSREDGLPPHKTFTGGTFLESDPERRAI